MKNNIILNIISVMIICPSLFGQSSAGHSITDYLDDQTAIVLQITPSQIDIDILVDKIIDFTQWTPDEEMYKKFQAVRPIAKKWTDDFIAAGGNDIYVIFSLADYPAFFILTPLTESSDADALKALLQQAQPAGEGNTCSPIYMDTFQQIGNIIFLGKQATWQRLQNTTPEPRWRWWNEYARTGFSSFKIGIMLSNDQKRVLKEMYPKLPNNFGALSTKTLLQAIDEIGITAIFNCNLTPASPPFINIMMAIQTPSPATAAFLQESLYAVPQLKNILQSANPDHPTATQLQDKLHYQIDLEHLKQLFTPWFQDMRAEVYNTSCMNRLQALGKAIALYQNDFKETNPTTLEALIDTEDVLPKMLTCPKSQSPYIYRGNDLSGKTPGDMILIHDNLDYHKDRVHVLYADCHVKALTPSEFLEAIKQDNLKRKELNFPEKQP